MSPRSGKNLSGSVDAVLTYALSRPEGMRDAGSTRRVQGMHLAKY